MTPAPVGHRPVVVGVLVASAGLVALLTARPAAADPPRPTDYRSTVDGIEPPAPGVRAKVIGGDAFLELRVDRGHEVTVEGYQGEPYLRFLPDGRVERNRHSPATYINNKRNGVVDVPPGVDEKATPDWETVARGGTYAWHDHASTGWAPGDRSARPPASGPSRGRSGWSPMESTGGSAAPWPSSGR